MPAEPMPFARVLDEIAATGYAGTELGDWGFMPTDPEALAGELAARDLSMIGAFVPIDFRHRATHIEGAREAVKVAKLLAAVAAGGEDRPAPLVVLADENGVNPRRTEWAGRIAPEMGLAGAEWDIYVEGVELVARRIAEETGLASVFHPHCAGWVETPEEIARLLAGTDPAHVNLAFDTGHFTYGAGEPPVLELQTALARFGDRIRHLHLKDCEPAVAARARAEGWDYFDAVRNGVFCELGRGSVDFAIVVAWMRQNAYRDWLVVEQDVLPGMGMPRESAERNRAYLASIGL